MLSMLNRLTSIELAAGPPLAAAVVKQGPAEDPTQIMCVRSFFANGLVPCPQCRSKWSRALKVYPFWPLCSNRTLTQSQGLLMARRGSPNAPPPQQI